MCSTRSMLYKGYHPWPQVVIVTVLNWFICRADDGSGFYIIRSKYSFPTKSTQGFKAELKSILVLRLSFTYFLVGEGIYSQ